MCCQVNASSWGVSPVHLTYGPLTVVNKQHVMVATYGLVKPDDATVMTHAHTFNGRQDAKLHVLCHEFISLVVSFDLVLNKHNIVTSWELNPGKAASLAADLVEHSYIKSCSQVCLASYKKLLFLSFTSGWLSCLI